MTFLDKRQNMKLVAAVTSLFLLGATACAQEAPALPLGLSANERENPKPELPRGLGTLAEEPGEGEPEPSLPTGLQVAPSPGPIPQEPEWPEEPWLDITGFWEVRAGYRLQNDAHEKEASIGETRVQLEMEKLWNGFMFSVTTDLLYDWVSENHTVNLDEGKGFLDLREASVAYSPFEFLDMKLGRQILTWGTGDLLFINDLFPKDWQAFFIGRDTEYLKAPSDALKTSFYTDLTNVDVVYTPEFDSDRFITGDRLSYWYGGRIVGNDSIIRPDRPDDAFKNDEWALRVSRNVGGYELAGYGYWGYWKSPAGFDMSSGHYTFPKLNVYGASMRGQVGQGIGNIEVGYYDSREDASGHDPLVSNSQMRYLVGYEQDLPEVAADFTVGVQYYVEQTLDYGDYRDSLSPGSKAVEEYRQLMTFRISKLYWNQNLTCSLFTYFSPSDRDVYMRPSVNYKVNDALAVEVGANVFWGDHPYTFFGQFEDNTNAYAAIRYSF